MALRYYRDRVQADGSPFAAIALILAEGEGMSAITSAATRRARLLAALACVLSLAVGALVLLGLHDGGWPLLVPSIGAAAVVIWPVRSVVAIAILLNAAIVILGLMTIGILYGFSLAALILALAALRPSDLQASGAAQ